MAKQNPSDLFPHWYFDVPTEAQLKRLESEEIRPFAGMTKGQASDLIGTTEPVEEEDLEALQHFNRPLRGMNQTRARHELALLFQDPANRESWEQRPPSSRLKEKCRFLGVKLSTGMTHKAADSALQSKYMALEEAGDPLAARFDGYVDVLTEFDDPVFREDYEIKKPSPTQIRAAIEALVADKASEGATWDSVCTETDKIAERLLELYPALAK